MHYFHLVVRKMDQFLLLLATAFCIYAGAFPKTAEYDGQSVHSRIKVDQPSILENGEFTVSLWFMNKEKIKYAHLDQCIFSKGEWRQHVTR